jgi:c-di-GMP-binding flagellar brake protein YcgR
VEAIFGRFMKEQRKQPRVNISFPVECKLVPSRDYFYTVSKDLSLGGTRIISNEQMNKKEDLELNIDLIETVLNIKAQVRWCSKEKKSQRYWTGLEFTALTEPAKDSLERFLAKIKHS